MRGIARAGTETGDPTVDPLLSLRSRRKTTLKRLERDKSGENASCSGENDSCNAIHAAKSRICDVKSRIHVAESRIDVHESGFTSRKAASRDREAGFRHAEAVARCLKQVQESVQARPGDDVHRRTRRTRSASHREPVRSFVSHAASHPSMPSDI